MNDERFTFRFMTWGIIATAVVALAGIAATFFAPTYTENVMSERRDRRDFRTATRLVAVELDRIHSRLGVMSGIEPGNVPGEMFIERTFITTEFDGHKPILAALLPDDDWKKVANAYTQLLATRNMLLPVAPLDDEHIRFLKRDVGFVKDAADVLKSAIAVHPAERSQIR